MDKFTGTQYLMIDIANNFGLDKKNWDERILWVLDHEHELEDLIKQAKEPALYYAGVRAYRDTLKRIPSGYPISLDACSSGLQILSCLVGCRAGASICGVISTGNRENAYEIIYLEMMKRSNNNASIDLDKVKKAIMTSLYGSTSIPKEVFGEGAMLNLFYEVMNDLAPGAWALNGYFLNIWNPTALEYSWVLPDNFHVHDKVKGIEIETFNFGGTAFELARKVNAPTESGRSIGANVTHSVDGYIVREIVRRCDYKKSQVDYMRHCLSLRYEGPTKMDDHAEMVVTLMRHYEKTGLLSARIFDYINEDNINLVHDRDALHALLDSLPAKPFHVITVHDCFRVLPNYGNDIRQQYNNLLAELSGSNLLSEIVSSIVGKPTVIGKLEENLAPEIRVADYTLS